MPGRNMAAIGGHFFVISCGEDRLDGVHRTKMTACSRQYDDKFSLSALERIGQSAYS
jgi:hypothetical protein